MLAVAVC